MAIRAMKERRASRRLVRLPRLKGSIPTTDVDSVCPNGGSSSFSRGFRQKRHRNRPPKTKLPVLTASPPWILVFSGQKSTVKNSIQATLVSTQNLSVRKKCSPSDDVVLISAWLNTIKDAIVGNEQKAGSFWKRIAAYFAASPKVERGAEREAIQCKQRWQKMNDLVCKFCGA
ncbi:hypothetical protein N665_0172s0091 [Sinapis alba]|nr:hypothetical protein N665_0172s0091 [Sinapis alba]